MIIAHASKNSHCSYCGSYFSEQEKWPRRCIICDNITYCNPTPVSVSLIRVLVDCNKLGILVVRRAADPKFGEWALPGGYLVVQESWEEGAVRELHEEVGIKLDPSKIETYHVSNATENSNLLIFHTYQDIIMWNEILEHFIPNNEVLDIDVCFLPTELCFSTHTKCLEKYLKEISK